MLRQSQRIETVGGIIELTKPSDIRLYNVLKSHELTAEELYNEMRWGNPSSKLFHAGILQGLITTKTIMYLIAKGAINGGNFQEYLPLKHMHDDMVSVCLHALHLSTAELENLYFSMVDRDGKPRPTAFPLSTIMPLAQSMHAKLVANSIDPAVIPSYIVTLDNLFVKSFAKLKLKVQTHVSDLRDSKYRERSRSTQEMTIEEFRISGDHVDAIKAQLATAKNDGEVMLQVISKINNLEIDIDKIDVASLDNVQLFKAECEHIKRYVKFAIEYGHYHTSITSYLSSLKHEVCSHLHTYMSSETRQQLKLAEEKLHAAEKMLNQAEDHLDTAKDKLQSTRPRAGSGFSASASAVAGSSQTGFGIFQTTSGAFRTSGSMVFEVVTSSLRESQIRENGERAREAYRVAEAELGKAAHEKDEAEQAFAMAESEVEALRMNVAESAGIGKLYGCISSVRNRMDLDDSLTKIGEVTDTLLELKQKTKDKFAHLYESHLGKLKKLQFVPAAPAAEAASTFLAVKQDAGHRSHAPSPRVGRRSRNPTPVVSPATSPSPFRK